MPPSPAERTLLDVNHTLFLVVHFMGVMRILIGAAPFVAAGPSSRMLGFPAEHDNPTTRLMARMFGVRDMGLGVLAFYAARHPEAMTFLFLFNAAMDGGDLFSIALPIVRRSGIDKAAVLSAAFAITGGAAWITVWALTR
ncbi:MAG: DUF4267 domain-containing protein [Polyangiales bacterium]